MRNETSKSFNLSFDVYWLGFIKTCLRPLVRILIKQKVEFNSFQNLVRGLFVEEAEKYILETSENSRGKISSIAYQTGLDRREVSKLLKEKSSEQDSDLIEQARSRESNIIEHWTTVQPYCDADLKPIPLKRSGSGLSFETLVQRFGKNISHGPILEALLEAKCVQIINNKVHLISKSYIPKLNVSTQKINIAAQSIKRIINTIDDNFDSIKDTKFQRNLYSIRIPKEKLPEFRKELAALIVDIYENNLFKRFEKIESKYEKTRNERNEPPVGLGIFYFED